MKRRAFLQFLAAGVTATYALDPEELLWVPGKKTIFLPDAAKPRKGVPYVFQHLETNERLEIVTAARYRVGSRLHGFVCVFAP